LRRTKFPIASGALPTAAWSLAGSRFLIYLFVLSGQLAGVGFLVAAKSVFRFGELKEHHNRLEAEYITIGTLMSFSWGLAASLITRQVLDAV
jgi:hypothetical protein